MRSKAHLFPILVLLAAAVLMGSLLSGCASKTNTSRRGVQAIPVQTVAAQLGDISNVNALTGVVTANIMTDVGTKVAGRVQSVYVDVGEHVAAGQAMAQLDTIDLEGELAQDKAQVQIDQAQIPDAQATLTRDQQLLAVGSTSQATVDDDQAKLQADQATLAKDKAGAAIIQQQINEMTITSPVDGIVSARDIEVGEQVSTDTTCFGVTQNSILFVTVNISEQEITGINTGTTAQISVPEIGTAVFQGQVTNVSPSLDPSSQAYPVKIQIMNPDPKILPGMTATVLFTGLQAQPGVIIPAQAIEETPQGSEVFTVENNVAHLHLVQIGATSSTEAVVTSGVQAGEQVVVNGQDLLSDNVRVTVVQNANQAGVQGLITQIQQGAKQGAAGAKRGAAQ